MCVYTYTYNTYDTHYIYISEGGESEKNKNTHMRVQRRGWHRRSISVPNSWCMLRGRANWANGPLGSWTPRSKKMPRCTVTRILKQKPVCVCERERERESVCVCV